MKKPLTLTIFLYELQNTESVITTIDEEWCDWIELLKIVGKFNDKHTKKIAIVPLHSGFADLKVLNEDNEIMSEEETDAMLNSFDGLFAHSWSKGEFINYMTQENFF